MEDEEIKKVVEDPSNFDFFTLQDVFLFKEKSFAFLRVSKELNCQGGS